MVQQASARLFLYFWTLSWFLSLRPVAVIVRNQKMFRSSGEFSVLIHEKTLGVGVKIGSFFFYFREKICSTQNKYYFRENVYINLKNLFKVKLMSMFCKTESFIFVTLKCTFPEIIFVALDLVFLSQTLCWSFFYYYFKTKLWKNKR